MANFSFNSLQECLEEFKAGRPIILVDDENRENEGDLVMPAQFATTEWINFMIHHGKGLICAPISSSRALELNLPHMLSKNQSSHETAFTVSIDAKEGTSTGISAKDRATTLSKLCSPDAKADSFTRPGHLFPLVAKDGGVLERPGHTEASLDLCQLAGLYPCAVICEVINPDGSMSRLNDLIKMGQDWNLKILSIEAIKIARMQQEQLLSVQAQCLLPTKYGTLSFTLLKNSLTHEEVICLSHPEKKSNLVRVHSSCMTSEVFGSLRCDCASQLDLALQHINQEGGHLIYLFQEGRGIGLENKIKAYQLQDQENLDTVDANLALGHPIDARTYDNAYFAIKWLGLTELELWTNNPLKQEYLKSLGLKVLRKHSVPTSNKFNENYLQTKINRLGHHQSLLGH